MLGPKRAGAEGSTQASQQRCSYRVLGGSAGTPFSGARSRPGTALRSRRAESRGVPLGRSRCLFVETGPPCVSRILACDAQRGHHCPEQTTLPVSIHVARPPHAPPSHPSQRHLGRRSANARLCPNAVHANTHKIQEVPASRRGTVVRHRVSMASCCRGRGEMRARTLCAASSSASRPAPACLLPSTSFRSNASSLEPAITNTHKRRDPLRAVKALVCGRGILTRSLSTSHPKLPLFAGALGLEAINTHQSSLSQFACLPVGH